jgi:MoxR-like ATPase
MREGRIWELLEEVVPYTPRILLYGKPGTGKTYQANTLGLRENQEVYNITLTHDSTAAELMGHYVATDNGGFEWLDGVGVRAWKEGARLVINEIDHAGVDVMTFLHALLDDPKFAKFTLPNRAKETVRPKEGFQVVATMNGVPADLPDALRDRFPVNLAINEVHPSALESLPKKLQSVYQDYNEGNFSVRKWSAFAELLDKGCELTTAANVVFTDNCADIIDALSEQDKDE